MLTLNTRGAKVNNEWHAKPFCQCWNKRTPVSWKQLSECSCGEENNETEWKWEEPSARNSSSVVLSDDQTQVTFHPFYSSGTAAVRGDCPLELDHHYYWEVKMLTETYGTDIMIGVGTAAVDVGAPVNRFTSLLGADAQSYGLSYKGCLRHDAAVARDAGGFCRGTIVGVRLDLWQGTLEFYLNRVPQGIAFFNLRRHPALYPMLSSTAAQSALRLTHSSSWRASLLVDAARSLAAAAATAAAAAAAAGAAGAGGGAGREGGPRLPPGLWQLMRDKFWLALPSEGCIDEDAEMSEPVTPPRAKNVIEDMFPSEFVNGLYADGVERNFRVVVWQ